MAVPAYLWILGGGGAALALSAAAKPTPPKRARGVARARGPSSLARWSPEARRLAPQVPGGAAAAAPLSLARYADRRKIKPPPMAGDPLRAWADLVERMMPVTRSCWAAGELIDEARAKATQNDDWWPLFYALQVGAMFAAANGARANYGYVGGPASHKGMDAVNFTVDALKHIVFDPPWTSGMTDQKVRARVENVIKGMLKGTMAPEVDPVLGLNCNAWIPMMQEKYKDVFPYEDQQGGCQMRMDRIRHARDRLYAQGGPKRAPMKELRLRFSDIARARVGAHWSNVASGPSKLPGGLVDFLAVFANVVGGPGASLAMYEVLEGR